MENSLLPTNSPLPLNLLVSLFKTARSSSWKGLAYGSLVKTSSGPVSASAFLPNRNDAEKDLFGCFGITALLLLISESDAEELVPDFLSSSLPAPKTNL